MNPALATINCVEPKHALARNLAVRETQLKNNKLPLSAAPHRAVDHSTSQNHWPLIFAISLIDLGRAIHLPSHSSPNFSQFFSNRRDPITRPCRALQPTPDNLDSSNFGHSEFARWRAFQGFMPRGERGRNLRALRRIHCGPCPDRTADHPLAVPLLCLPYFRARDFSYLQAPSDSQSEANLTGKHNRPRSRSGFRILSDRPNMAAPL
jgi:hypothetical protein